MAIKMDPLLVSTASGSTVLPAKNSPPACQTANPAVAKVANGVMQDAKSFFSAVVNPICNKLLVTSVDLLYTLKKHDEGFLIQLTNTNVSLILKQVAPQLPVAIQALLEDGFVKQFSQKESGTTEKLGELVMIHVVANLAKSLYPEAAIEFGSNKKIQKTISLEDFHVAAAKEMMLLFAEELNLIDEEVANGADIVPELFNNLTKKLLARILPQNDSGLVNIGVKFEKSVIGIFDLEKKISVQLMKTYEPFGNWLSGGAFELQKSGNLDNLIPILENLGSYTAERMSRHYMKDDEALLLKLTGVDDVQQIVKMVSQKLSTGPGILKRKETVENVFSFVVLKVITNISREVFEKEIANGDTVKFDDFIIRISMGVSDIFGVHLQTIKQHPKHLPLTDKLFQPLTEHLLKMVLPNDPIIQSFLARRKNRLTEDLSSFLKNLYSCVALRDDAEEYKQRLRQIFWNPEEIENPTEEDLPEIPDEDLSVQFGIEKIVKQLYNACFNITDIGRNFVADKFSDPKVGIAQLQDTFNSKCLSEEILDDLGDEIYDLMNEEEGIESSQELLVELRELFDPTEIPDQLLEKIAEISFRFIETQEILNSQSITDYLREEFNEENIVEKLFPGIAGVVSKLIQLNHKISDAKMISDHLRNKFTSSELSDAILDKIAKSSIALLQSNKKISSPKVIFDHLVKNVPLPLSNSLFISVANEIFALANPKNPLNWLAPTIQNALHITLFKALVHLLEKVDKKDRAPLKNLFPAALQILLNVSAEELPVIIAGMKNISNPEDYQLLMAPFVDKLIYLFFEDADGEGATLEDHLPIPDEIKPFVAESIRKNAYKLILPMIEASTSWIDAKEKNQKRLDKLYGNSHASQACRLGGAFTAQSIPYHFQESHELFAETIIDNYSYLFASRKGKEPSKKKRKLKEMVDFTMESIANNQTPAMKNLFSFIQNFSEAAFLRCFADLSECLDQLDQDSKDDDDGTMLVQGTTILLRELKDHLALIAEVKEDLKQYKAGKIPLDVMMDKFDKADKLHPALADGTLQQRELFFQNISEKLLDIVGVNKDAKLPLPQFLKSPLWGAFEGKLMPLILLKLFEKVTDPHTLNLILINLFQQINADNGNVDVSIADEDIRKYNDAPQDVLEDLSGGLIKALTQMQRSGLARVAMKNDKIEKLAGQAMAQPLRDVLQAKSLKKIIDDLIVSLVPNLHPGHWNDQSGTYICVKAMNKTQVVIPEPDFSHIFPRTKKEKAACHKAQVKAEKTAQKELVKEITHTIENQTQYIFLGFFRKLWKKLRNLIDLMIDKSCGKAAKRLKRKINRFLDGAAYYFIKPVLILTTYPILLTVKRLLRFYIVNKSTGFAGDVSGLKGIHSNIFYSVINDILTLISDAKSSYDLTESEELSSSSSY